ncbi:hypothetical protein F9789_2222 [Staphylococcus arlettae]|nr:hypothetical protein [Staphylococcus arlettae]
MKLAVYSINIINYIFISAMFLLSITPPNWYGADKLDVFISNSSALLIFSILMFFISKNTKTIWKTSIFLNLIILFILTPLIMFVLFFGIPFT